MHILYFFFVSSLIELIAGRSEHANESGKKKKKRANHGKAKSFLKLILIVEKNKEQLKFEEHYWVFFDDESIDSFFFLWREFR